MGNLSTQHDRCYPRSLSTAAGCKHVCQRVACSPSAGRGMPPPTRLPHPTAGRLRGRDLCLSAPPAPAHAHKPHVSLDPPPPPPHTHTHPTHPPTHPPARPPPQNKTIMAQLDKGDEECLANKKIRCVPAKPPFRYSVKITGETLPPRTQGPPLAAWCPPPPPAMGVTRSAACLCRLMEPRSCAQPTPRLSDCARPTAHEPQAPKHVPASGPHRPCTPHALLSQSAPVPRPHPSLFYHRAPCTIA